MVKPINLPSGKLTYSRPWEIGVEVSNKKWWFSGSMLVYQGVIIVFILIFAAWNWNHPHMCQDLKMDKQW